METAFSWLGTIAETLINAFPHLKIVDVTQGGVKMRRGVEIIELTPGLCFYWPLITVIRVIPVVRDTLELSAQTFATKDGKTVLATGMITYSVRDVVKLLTTAPDYVNTINDLAVAAIHDVLKQHDWEALQTSNDDLRRELKRAVTDALSGFGVRIISVGLKDLAPCKVFKLVQDSSN